ncbi:MAG: 4-(cytidine 5'-diphospho)-2-C-methyl-D-erythritol kinase [Verrucomicrobiae bacterium]|nr:4-(cytidine 5'-diphospho)-2-C-methyl-D-erythritol kinase [Verrucomicrobiae bacterium]
MALERSSPCKVNLLLNVLGRRADGYHELETIFHPVALCDTLRFERGGNGVSLTCSDPRLPTDASNLVHRAATAFLESAGISDGVRIHLEKRIPLAAGLGGGSGNAATTLSGLNELFGRPLSPVQLQTLAARLGSDVPFFLQDRPALATGRGEHIEPLDFFPALRGRALVLVNPGFGVSTPWAYQQLAAFPEALNGRPGRAGRLLELLGGTDTRAAAAALYNALEAPVLTKYPILALYQEFMRARGALGTLLCGSGSTTFAIAENADAGEELARRFLERFGSNCWTAVVALPGR